MKDDGRVARHARFVDRAVWLLDTVVPLSHAPHDLALHPTDAVWHLMVLRRGESERRQSVTHRNGRDAIVLVCFLRLDVVPPLHKVRSDIASGLLPAPHRHVLPSVASFILAVKVWR